MKSAELRSALIDLAFQILEECGCCGSYHPIDYTGDCRNDNKRFSHPDDLAEVWFDIFENRTSYLREVSRHGKNM